MSCFEPIPARDLGGKMKLLSRAAEKEAHVRKYATHWLPCGVCLGCRDAQTAAWAIRLKHESRLHSHNTFLTLTYDDEHVPEGLQVHHMQKFWKRLRKNVPKFKHFYCGEYGDRTKRPHYHAATFGFAMPTDAKKYDSENMESAQINELWGMGQVTLSELTPYRMAYVAGYVLKKAGYKKQRYLVAGDDGIAIEVQPPFRKMSQGLGKGWLTKYGNDLRMGYVQHDERKLPIPRYYKDKLEESDPHLYNYIKEQNDRERRQREPPDRARNKAAEEIRRQQLARARRDRI